MGRLYSEHKLEKDRIYQKNYMKTERGIESRKKYLSRPDVKARINKGQLIRRKEMREIAIEMGTCTICFKRPATMGKKTCSECRERAKSYSKKHYAQLNKREVK